MQIPPYLERLLLSNEAVFKNASLGLSGQNMVFVPQGKTAVILEVSIEPFTNSVGTKFMELITNGVIEENTSTTYINAIRRLCYQLQIINDKYATYINLSNEFELQNTQFTQADASEKLTQVINLQFKGKREELFIYIDRSLYFNIIFPWKDFEEGGVGTGITPTYTDANNGFLPKIQNLPEEPTTFYKNNFEDYLVRAEINTPGLDHYYPCNHQTNPAFSSELPQQEYFHLVNIVNENTIRQPVASGVPYAFHDLMTLPLINVKYALLNKRPEDYGITKPGK